MSGLRRGWAVIATAVLALVVLASGARPWVRGQVSDPVLASSSLTINGSDAAAGAVAAALVALAGMLAAVTGGRIVRWIGAAAMTAGGVLVTVLAARVLMSPQDAVGRQAATRTGRTGSIAATGEVTWWVPTVLTAGVGLTVLGVATLLAVRGWGGLTSRYDAPTESADESARSTAAESDWDRLSKGEDPT